MVRLYGEAHLSREWAQGGKPVVPLVLGARKDGAESQQLNDPRANQPDGGPPACYAGSHWPSKQHNPRRKDPMIRPSYLTRMLRATRLSLAAQKARLRGAFNAAAELPGVARTLIRDSEKQRAQRWARQTYFELDRSFFQPIKHGAPTPTDGLWVTGIEIVPEEAFAGLVGWRLVVERKRTLHAHLETSDRMPSWTRIASKEFPIDTPSLSLARWALQVIRAGFIDYLKSLRHAIQFAFERNGDDAAVRDAGLDVVADRQAEDLTAWLFVVDLLGIPNHIFLVAITLHAVLLIALTGGRPGEEIGRKQIVAGTTAAQIATWVRELVSSQSQTRGWVRSLQ